MGDEKERERAAQIENGAGWEPRRKPEKRGGFRVTKGRFERIEKKKSSPLITRDGS